MATIRIFPRLDQIDKKGMTTLRIEVQSKGSKVRHQVPSVRIRPEHWDAEQKRVTNGHANYQGINRIIQKTLSDVERIVLEMEYRGDGFNRDMLQAQLKGYDDTSVYDFWERTMEGRGSNISAGTKSIFKTSLMKLKMFKPTLLFSEITLEFLERFESYLRDEHSNRDNTIHKNIKNLKTIVNRAEDALGITCKGFAIYKLPHEDTFREVISLVELDQMLDLLYSERMLKFSGRGSQESLALFCLQALTGLRYTDAKAFDVAEYVKGDKIIVGTDKTGGLVYIPIHKRLLRLLDYQNYIFDAPTNQAMNRLLAGIAISAEISIKLTSHVAVHSFCTICIELGIPIEVISKLRGHASIRTTQIYVQIKNKYIEEQMKKWDAEDQQPALEKISRKLTKANSVFVTDNNGYWYCIHEDELDIFNIMNKEAYAKLDFVQFASKFAGALIHTTPNEFRKTLK